MPTPKQRQRKKLTATALKKYLRPQALPDTPILLVFHADFCPPCRSFKRNMLPKIQRQLQDKLTIIDVDIEEEAGDQLYWKYANPYRIKGMPYFILFDKKGRENGHLSGYSPKKIREMLQKLYPKYKES
ncbi:MAG: thioredoxin family protein [Candidatus Ranarchaeia archaeon]